VHRSVLQALVHHSVHVPYVPVHLSVIHVILHRGSSSPCAPRYTSCDSSPQCPRISCACAPSPCIHQSLILLHLCTDVSPQFSCENSAVPRQPVPEVYMLLWCSVAAVGTGAAEPDGGAQATGHHPLPGHRQPAPHHLLAQIRW
jgi:hypothetical protein